MTETEGTRDLVEENAGKPFHTIIRNTFSYTASWSPMWVSVWRSRMSRRAHCHQLKRIWALIIFLTDE